MNSPESLKIQIPLIESKIGYSFRDQNLLILALTHRSYTNEHKELQSEHNERLEFLGDVVLGLIISEHLYKYLPETPEGELSFLRSRMVDASSCRELVKKLELEEFLLLGKGERMGDRRGRDSILANLFEALLGAIYLDGGLDPSRAFIFENFSREISETLRAPIHNWKAALQDYAQKERRCTPHYEVLSESGPDHNKKFEVAVFFEKEMQAKGSGSSKKLAQQSAAQAALEKLGVV